MKKPNLATGLFIAFGYMGFAVFFQLLNLSAGEAALINLLVLAFGLMVVANLHALQVLRDILPTPLPGSPFCSSSCLLS